MKFISQQQELLERKTRFSVEQTVEVSTAYSTKSKAFHPLACKAGSYATRGEKVMYSKSILRSMHRRYGKSHRY